MSKGQLDCIWKAMAHGQKPDFVFRRNGRVHLNRLGRQFSWLLAAEVCASAVVMLHTPCSEVVWRVLATHSIRQFPLHFPSLASPRAITFQPDSTERTRDDVRSYKVTKLIILCEPVRELFRIRCINVSVMTAVNYRCYVYSIRNLNKSLRGVFLSYWTTERLQSFCHKMCLYVETEYIFH